MRDRGFFDRTLAALGERHVYDGTLWSYGFVHDAPEEFEIRPAPDRVPGLLFVQGGETKVSKNRLHLDFRPDDQPSEVDRLLELGARRVDIGQGQQSWVVLADPEGNEFCVLSSRAR